MSKEIWKRHEEGLYAVSHLGRIKQLKDTDKIKAGTILQPSQGKEYLFVSLRLNGSRKTRSLHQFVALVWKGPCPRGKEVNHKDGVKTNCKPKNLEYVTHKKNLKHAYKNGLALALKGRNHPMYNIKGDEHPCFGLDHSGEKCGTSKLTWIKVRKIRTLYAKGFLQKILAEKFSVTQATISDIVSNKTWIEL